MMRRMDCVLFGSDEARGVVPTRQLRAAGKLGERLGCCTKSLWLDFPPYMPPSCCNRRSNRM
eukprot:5363847-Pyramimonas_sp.AAC.1